MNPLPENEFVLSGRASHGIVEEPCAAFRPLRYFDSGSNTVDLLELCAGHLVLWRSSPVHVSLRFLRILFLLQADGIDLLEDQ